ncbi:glutamate-cysteine ligase [Aureococcus anophagefferens]|nr:glutamate-cysteine ligase [Aureococcus anophagefferens]
MARRAVLAVVALCTVVGGLVAPPAAVRRARRHEAILTVGTPLRWPDAVDKLAYVREHGIAQFIEMMKRSDALDRSDELLWGDELEYAVLRVHDDFARASLRGPEIRDWLIEKEDLHAYRTEGCAWMPEYGRWMLEGTPRRPYGGYAADLVRVERNMRLRRRRLLSALRDDEICPTLVTFPGFGVGDFCELADGTVPPAGGDVARSATVPDAAIHPHPRFAALTANIRDRRGDGNVHFAPPRFVDAETPADAPATIEGLDAMAYGMGCCCLQVTFQARDATEARYCYDQLAALAPVMLALTAAAPAWRGALADSDALGRRRGVKRFCDVDAPVDAKALETLLAAGIDEALARHVAHLFVRDPLVLFEGMVEELDDAVATDHFDNLQSTNWNTVRLKPPVGLNPEGEPGWRTEFRPMEVQLTDFENAAFSVFTVLVTRVILAFDLSLYVPLSRVDANMRRAQRRDAVNVEKFYFRRQLAPTENEQNKFNNCCGGEDDDVFEEMTCAEIIDGKGDYFPGLAPLAYAYLDHIGCDQGTFARISDYIELVRKKARGEAWTGAKWIREFVTNHPEYARDSVISPKVARDLAVAAHEVGVGARDAKALTGGVAIKPVSADGAWDTRLSPDKIPTADERKKLVLKYAKRGPFEGKFDPSSGARARARGQTISAKRTPPPPLVTSAGGVDRPKRRPAAAQSARLRPRLGSSWVER